MADSEREAVAKLYPLKVGNKISTSHAGRSSRGYQYIVDNFTEVKGIEKVTVPAGTFETFVIDTEMSNRPYWEGQNTCWYSPVIGYCVKRKWKSSNNDNFDWELVSVATPKPGDVSISTTAPPMSEGGLAQKLVEGSPWRFETKYENTVYSFRFGPVNQFV